MNKICTAVPRERPRIDHSSQRVSGDRPEIDAFHPLMTIYNFLFPLVSKRGTKYKMYAKERMSRNAWVL